MKKVNLLTQILIAFIIAIFLGILVGPNIKAVQPLGDLFLRLIKFIIVPLVFSSLIVGVASTGDMKKIGRMGGKTIVYYLVTTMIAITLGLVLGNLLSPGSGIETSANASI